MESTGNRPLVSMAMTTYNRKEYIREALAGVFAQTYDPLEIVISDDCSTDGTWEIINEEVEKFRACGGRHKIVLNRNEQNLKVLGNFEKLISMCQGELLIQCGDDDVSLPERATRTVEAWLKSGRKATMFMVDAIVMDMSGNSVGRYCAGINVEGVPKIRGAMAAYSLSAMKSYPRCGKSIAWEDWIYAARCTLMGECLCLHEALVKYRLGGVSTVTSFRGVRKKLINQCHIRLAAFKQIRLDIEVARNRGANENRVAAWRRSIILSEYFQNLNLLKLSGGTFGDRWKMFCLMTKGRSFLSLKFWIYAVLLAPGFLTAPVYTLQAYRTARMNAKGGEL